MARNRKTASLLAGMTLFVSLMASLVIFIYLPHAVERYWYTSVCVLAGLLVSGAVYFAVSLLPDRRLFRTAAIGLFCAVALVPVASVFYGQITYSRFGLTIYGAVPIPALDITVNRNGLLWFRTKTHQITRSEIEKLLAADVEVVIVGNGWSSIARLTDEAELLADILDLRVLPTPDAFALYNSLRRQGKCVVLLAHSTC